MVNLSQFFVLILIICLWFEISYCSFSNSFEIRDIINNNETYFISELQSWTLPNITEETYSNCSSELYLGGNGTLKGDGNYSKRIYKNLPPHDIIYFTFKFQLYDYWDNTDYFSLKFDATEMPFDNFINNYTDFGDDVCGEVGRKGVVIKLIGKVFHTGPQLTLRVISYLSGPPSDKSFGFRLVKMIFANKTVNDNEDLCAITGIPLLTKKCSCPAGTYSVGGVCLSCSPDCANCFGPSPAECFECSNDRKFNGTECEKCHDTCNVCFGETVNTCKVCSKSSLYLLETTCISDCDSPLVVKSSNPKTCMSPCDPSEYIYPDRSCDLSCTTPLAPYDKYGKIFCSSPCTTGQVLYFNGSCYPSCDYPLKLLPYRMYQVCGYPCDNGNILYYNDTCLPLSSCTYPFILQTFNNYKVCVIPCPSPSNFINWNNTCQTICPSPLRPDTVNTLKLCKLPKCGTQICPTCQTDRDCPIYHYCNMTIGGVCLPYITYTLDAEIIKNILNGYIIRAEVLPTLGFEGGEDDILIIDIDSLQVGNDYTATFNKLSKGVFLINIEIQKPLQLDKLQAHFTYSPNGYSLPADLTLPKVVYISSSTKKAAQMVQTGSYVSFGILFIDTIGFLLNGGLSVLWSFLPENQYSYYLIYLNVNYPYNTKVYLRSLANYNLLLSSTSEEANNKTLTRSDLTESLPAKFIDEEYSTNFMDSTGQVIAMIIVISIMIGVVSFLFNCLALPRRSYMAHKVLKTFKRVLKWNGVVRNFLAYVLPTVLASLVQVHMFLFGKQSSSLSLLFSSVTLLLVSIGFYGTLWEDLNLNSSTRYYYWFVGVRGVLIAYVSIFFNVYPYAQIGILLGYQCLIMSLFFKGCRCHRVFNVRSLNVVTFINEFLLLTAKGIILVFLVFEHRFSEDNHFILGGWLMIVPGALAQVLQTLYSTIIQLQASKKMLVRIKNALISMCKKNKKKKKVKKDCC